MSTLHPEKTPTNLPRSRPKVKKEKKPRNSKVWIILSAVLIVLGVTTFFVTPIVLNQVRLQQKKAIVLKSTKLFRAPSSSAPKTLEPKADTEPSYSPATRWIPDVEQVDKTMDAVDRIFDSLSKWAGTLMAVIGALAASREYRDHKKRKKQTP